MMVGLIGIRRYVVLVSMLSVLVLGVSGCGRNLASNVRTSSAVSGKVIEGTVLSASAVVIKDTDSLKKNAMGGVAGGLAGGIAGSSVGRGTGSALAAVGGAVAAGMLGSYLEDQLSTSEGFEYIVRIDPKYLKEHQAITKRYSVDYGNKTVDDQISDSVSVQTSSTSIISVVQQDQVMLQPGQRVLIVYNEDRPRLVAAGY